MVSTSASGLWFPGLVLTVQQPARSPISPINPRVEMFQRGQPKDTFFNMKTLEPRPMSEATEMFDTDFEDDESEEEDNSPRLSLNSVRKTYSDFCHNTNEAMYRRAEEAKLHYPRSKKYIRRVRTSSNHLISIYQRRSRWRDRQDHISSEVPSSHTCPSHNSTKSRS